MLKMILLIFHIIQKTSTLIFISLKHCSIVLNFFIIINLQSLHLTDFFKVQSALSVIIYKLIIISELDILIFNMIFKHSSSLTH